MTTQIPTLRQFIPLIILDLIVTFCITYFASIIPLSLSPTQIPTFDLTPPEIKLNGEPDVIVYAGEDYNDPGATAVDIFGDNISEIPTVTNGRVNMAIPAKYLLSYSATDDSGNTAVASRTVTVLPRNTGIIYLTFDDGPSQYTAQLLDVLAKYGVKATFFVTNAGSDDMLRREYNEGHAIGLHSYTHDYSYIYASVDNYFEDLYRVQERVRNATGYTSYLMRFPGGSSNLVSARYDGGGHIMSILAREVEARGFTFFDWNVTSGDAGETTNSNTVYNNVISRVYSDGKSVVLQHDIKSFSVDAVERIIEWGLANGFTFAKLDASSFTARHRINN